MSYSQLISSIEESATLGIAQKVRELKAKGKDVIGLTLGEPDFDTPEHIRTAAKEALDAGYTHYPPVTGLPELKDAIVHKLKRDNNLSYEPGNVMVSTGAKQSLYNIVLAKINPGDEVVIPAPFWVSYEAMVLFAQGKPVYIPTTIESEYKITPEQLEAAITPKTRLFFFNSPSNPSGSMYSREEMAGLVAVLERHPEVSIISDEIYEYITYGKAHESLASFASIFDRVITVNGFAKGFAMTGWRLGYIATVDKTLLSLCSKIQGQSTSGANAFAQKGAVVALGDHMAPTYAMRDEFRVRRDKVYARLKEIPGVKVNLPDGAFYFYPDFASYIGKANPQGQKIENIDQLCLYLIEEEGLALVTGSAFGTPSHARLSYAYSNEILNDGLTRLESGLSKLS